MERLTKKSNKIPTKLFAFAFATLGLMFTLASCGNKGGSDYVPPVVVPIYGNGCTNCGSITSPITLATFTSRGLYFSLENMVVTGQNNGTVPSASGSMYKGYIGPVAAHGQFVVPQQIYDNSNWGYSSQTTATCTIPAGTYTIQSQLVGSMNDVMKAGGDITLPSLYTTSGGIELAIEAPTAYYGFGFLNNGQSLWAKVSILRVNGVTCSQGFADVVQ